MEYNFKQEKIKGLKKEIKDAFSEIEHKKQTLTYMQGELQKTPQDLNRNQYLKRINEIISNLKAQKKEIKGILDEVRDIQKDTEGVLKGIQRLDNEIEEFIFNEAKKDKVAAGIYKEIVSLKEKFDKLVVNIQETNKMKNGIRDIESKLEDFRIKYKNMEEINKLEHDLNGIKQENMNLKR